MLPNPTPYSESKLLSSQWRLIDLPVCFLIALLSLSNFLLDCMKMKMRIKLQQTTFKLECSRHVCLSFPLEESKGLSLKPFFVYSFILK